MSRFIPLARPLGRAIVILALVCAPQLPAQLPVAHASDKPFTAQIRPVTPDPRASPVESVEIVFSAPPDRETLATASLRLSRSANGSTEQLPLVGVVTLSWLDDRTVLVENLRVVTVPDGIYRLTLLASGATNRHGTPLATDVSEEWRVDLSGPLVAAVGPVVPDQRTDAVPSVDVRFSEPIDAATFSVDDLALSRDGRPLGVSQLLITRLTDTVYRIGGLESITAARGTYALTVSPAGIADLLGNTGVAAFARSDTWAVVTRPNVLAVGPVTPDPRRAAVESVDVRFSEPIVAATFTTADLALTRDGTPQTLSAVNITPVSATLFHVTGLAALTGAGGRYEFAVDAAGVKDVEDGVTGAGSLATSWTTDTSAPTATLSAANISVAGGGSHLLNVMYGDSLGLAEETLGDGDISVAGPGGFAVEATLLGFTAPTPTQRIAVYRVGAPGGSWDEADNGVYTVSLAPDAVRDTVGNGAAGGPLGAFSVQTPWVRYLPVVGVGFRP